jgi:XTP/dITP diphosphohydrolase
MLLRCATSNPGKLREFRMAATHWGFDSIRIEPIEGLEGIPAPEETGRTFEANAESKAVYYSQYTDDLVFADDSGLAVQALGGRPGVYSARFAGPAATDVENNQHLLRQLEGAQNRAASFVCAIALAQGGRLQRLFHGEVAGRIVEAPRGTQGFGYDPLFFYEPFGCTFGEVEAARKMNVSHRGQALRSLLEFVSAQCPG